MSTASLRIATKPATPPRKAPTLAAPGLADLQRLTMHEVRALVGLSESTIRDKIKAGTFPAADFVDGPRCTRWSAGLVRRWLESTSTASTK